MVLWFFVGVCPTYCQAVANTYYERLGVSEDASTAEIKQAYRDRIKETHPDVSDDESAHDRTKALIEAKAVLTDETERDRYDRLGHEAYVSDDLTAETDSDAEASASRQSPSESGWGTSRTTGSRQSGYAGTRTGARQQASSAQQSSREADGGHTSRSAEWYSGTDGGQTASAEGAYRAWDTDRSYAVGEGQGMFEPAELLSSQRTVVLLGTTFIIYPVLLFGALLPTFPLAANLTVAMCIVLVIAFLQSVPRVGMVVFGTWTVLLPIVLFGVIGISPLTIQGVFAMAAVSFPLGLSVLTWIAIRPMRS